MKIVDSMKIGLKVYDGDIEDENYAGWCLVWTGEDENSPALHQEIGLQVIRAIARHRKEIEDG